MSLRFLVGPAGSGKTRKAFENLIEASPERSARSLSAFVIVPEQYSLQTQTDMMDLHPRHGSMDIDVISFERLAWLVIEEAGKEAPVLLDDLGQILLLRSVIGEVEDRLSGLKRNIRRPGFIEELKALISELGEYRVDDEKFSYLREACVGRPLLSGKLADLDAIRTAFRERLEERMLPKEDILHYFCRYIPGSKLLRGASVLLDGFTGFTPDQCEVIRELLKTAADVTVNLTLGSGLMLENVSSELDMFYPTVRTWRQLTALAAEAGVEVKAPEYLGGGTLPRFAHAPALAALEAGFGRFGVAKAAAGLPEDGRDGEAADPNSGEVRIVRADDPRREADFIASEICRLVRENGFRYRDIAVVCSDLTLYARHLERSFDVCEIPFFLDLTRTIDLNPFANLVLSVTEPAERGFTHESVFRLLKSGLTGVSAEEIDLLENFVLAHGIRGITKWKKTWISDEIPEIDEIKLRAAADLITLSEELKKKDRTVSEMLGLITGYLEEIGLEERLKQRAEALEEEGDLSLAMEYGRLWELTMLLFERIEAILGDEVLAPGELRDVLAEGFRRMRAGVIPQSMDSVLAGDLSRSRVGNIRILFFAGFNEGLLPDAGGEGGILSDLEREYIKAAGVELSPTPKENAVLQKLRTYQNLTRPTDRLYISFSAADEKGKAAYPSVYLTDITDLFGKEAVREAKELTGPDSRALTRKAARQMLAEMFQTLPESGDRTDLYAWFLTREEEREILRTLQRAATFRFEGEGIDPATSGELLEAALSGSATRLETYASCAYRWFLDCVLQLRERVIYELDTRDVGTLLHAVLEEYFRRMHEDGFGFGQNDGERRETVLACVEKVLASDSAFRVFGDSERQMFRADRLADICDRAVWALVEQGKRGDFMPEAQELAFSAAETDAMRVRLDDDTVMRLRGKIDRVDVFDDGQDCMVRIIDYKSGAKDLDLTMIYYGLQIQLFLYMDAAQEIERIRRKDRRVVPAGLFYFHVDDLWADMTEKLRNGEASPEEAVLECYRMKGYANSDPEVLRRIDRELVPEHAGKSPVIDAEYKKGELTSSSKVLSAQDLAQLQDHVRERIRIMGQSMMRGEIAQDPYVYGRSSSCDWCAYRGICAFEMRSPGFRWRRLEKKKHEDLGLV